MGCYYFFLSHKFVILQHFTIKLMIEYNNKSNGDETTKHKHLSLIRMAQKQKHLSYPLITSLDVYFQMLSQTSPNPFRVTPFNSSVHLSQYSVRLRLTCHILKKLSILSIPLIKSQTLYSRATSSQRAYKVLQQYYTTALQFIVNQFMIDDKKTGHAPHSSGNQNTLLFTQNNYQQLYVSEFSKFLYKKHESIKKSKLPTSKHFLTDILFHIEHYYQLCNVNGQQMPQKSQLSNQKQENTINQRKIIDQLLISKQFINQQYWSRVRVGLSVIQSHKKFKKWKDLVILRRGFMEPTKDFLNWVSSQHFQHSKVQELIDLLTRLDNIKLANHEGNLEQKSVQAILYQKLYQNKQNKKQQNPNQLPQSNVIMQNQEGWSMQQKYSFESQEIEIKQICYRIIYCDQSSDWQQLWKYVSQLQLYIKQCKQQNRITESNSFDLSKLQRLWACVIDSVQSYEENGVQSFFKRSMRDLFREFKNLRNDEIVNFRNKLDFIIKQLQHRRIVCQQVRVTDCTLKQLRFNFCPNIIENMDLQKKPEKSLSFQNFQRKLKIIISQFEKK